MGKQVRIGIIGDYVPLERSHAAINAAIENSAMRLSIDARYDWLPTEAIGRGGASQLDRCDGVWISSGSPYRSFEGALDGIRYAREHGKPLVGT